MEERVCHLAGDMFGVMACALTAVVFSGDWKVRGLTRRLLIDKL